MEVLLHGLGVKPNDDLGDLRLPFAVAPHFSPDGCRFMALSPDENKRGFRPCILLSRVLWTDFDRILTGLAHIVVRVLTAHVVEFSHGQECGKRFWDTIKAAVALNRAPLPSPMLGRTAELLDSLPPVTDREPYLQREVLEKV